MRYKNIVLFLVFLCITLSGCSQTTIKDTDDIEQIFINDIISVMEDEINPNWRVSKYNLTADSISGDPAEASSYCVQDNNIIYYLVSEVEEMHSSCYHYRIIKNNTKDNTSEVIYSYESNESWNNISRMELLDESLYWVENTIDGWNLVRYELGTEQYSIIDSFLTTNSIIKPSISVIGSKLFWYRGYENEEKTKLEIKLVNYDPNKRKIEELSIENLYLASPYTSVPNSEKYLLYTTKVDGEVWITQLNLETKDKIQINTHKKEVVYINSNDKYILWNLDWYNSIVNIYYYEDNKIYSLDLKNTDRNFRSCVFKDDEILLDFSTTEHEDKGYNLSAVYSLNIVDRTYMPVYIAESKWPYTEMLAWIGSKDNLIYIGGWVNEPNNTTREIVFLNKK